MAIHYKQAINTCITDQRKEKVRVMFMEKGAIYVLYIKRKNQGPNLLYSFMSSSASVCQIKSACLLL